MRAWRTALAERVAVARHVAAQLPCPPLFEGAAPTLRRIRNYYRLTLEWHRFAPVVRSAPARLCIESTSACNLACPHCFTGAGETSGREATLSLELYRRVLAELGDRLWQIEFHNWGEPLLNKHLPAMIAEATARGLSTAICTNLSLPFDERQAEALVSYGLKLMGVSIDGARQETYEQYRVDGQLERVLHNCRLLVEAKRRLGSRTPRMAWTYHVFAHNLDDVEPARALAEELEMDFHAARGRVVGADWDPEARWMPHEAVEPVPCYTLWHTAVLYGDGSLAPCRGSFYREDEVGRLAVGGRPGSATFLEAWNGARIRLARRFFGGHEGTPEEERHICFSCPHMADWHRYLGHLALGGKREHWKPQFTSNERYNYFWSRRPRADEPFALDRRRVAGCARS